MVSPAYEATIGPRVELRMVVSDQDLAMAYGKWLPCVASVCINRLQHYVATATLMTEGVLDETQALHMTPERRAMHAQIYCGMPYMPSICIQQAL
jgi:hypothetical protein